ncbi:MAG: transposase [Spirochaetaceae bacterium]|nr:transposase [Spirochaetaceae bacterium]
MARRQKYQKEYKEATAALSGREYRTVEQAAREPGLCGDALRHWRQEARKAGPGGPEAFPGLGTPRDAEAARLRRRAADLEEADEILKKAAAIFAESGPRQRRISL